MTMPLGPHKIKSKEFVEFEFEILWVKNSL